jgi:hypothetical protein
MIGLNLSLSRSGVLWTPKRISSLGVWLRADSLGLANGTPVQTWIDSSGNGMDVTQATMTSRPTFKTSGIGGKPSLLFDSVDDELISNNDFPVTGDAAFTVFSVHQQLSTTVRQCAVSWGIDVSLRGFNIYPNLRSTNQYDFSYTNNNDYRVAYGATTSPIILCHRKASGAINTTTTVRVNGTVSADRGGSSTSTPNLGLGKIYVGAFFSAAAKGYFNGYISEQLVYKRDLSSDEIARVEKYLAAKYDISLP